MDLLKRFFAVTSVWLFPGQYQWQARDISVPDELYNAPFFVLFGYRFRPWRNLILILLVTYLVCFALPAWYYSCPLCDKCPVPRPDNPCGDLVVIPDQGFLYCQRDLIMLNGVVTDNTETSPLERDKVQLRVEFTDPRTGRRVRNRKLTPAQGQCFVNAMTRQVINPSLI